jgi:hypothetical protein
VPTVSEPGFARAAAASSFMVLYGESSLTTTMYGASTTLPMNSKSLIGSNASRL